MKKVFSKLRCQKGAGLIEMVVMSGILIIVIQFMVQTFNNFKKFQRNKKLQMSTLFVKSYINNMVDCEKTMDALPGSCTPGQDIRLESTSQQHQDKNIALVRIGSLETNDEGEEFHDYRKIGRYVVRATCGADNNIQVQAMLVNKKKQSVKVTPNKYSTHYSCVIRTLYFGRNG
ncbi:MAG: hypothetical protein HRU09_16350, partial [Oligoflexales bacterium]|nr:hypothetical protein [Oligoflexales bacterium]